MEGQDKLIDYVADAHAMEESVKRMLDSLVETVEDPTIRSMLEEHRAETEEHVAMLEQRLSELGEGPSTRKQIEGMFGTLMKGVTDMVRSDKQGKIGRDAYVTEHAEIAAYELLCRFADRLGDRTTVDIATQILADERRMAGRLEECWDTFADMSVVEATDADGARSDGMAGTREDVGTTAGTSGMASGV